MVIKMDTIFVVESKKKFKLAVNFLNAAITIVLCLVLNGGLAAQESLLIANRVAPVLNTDVFEKSLVQKISQEEQSKKFDESVRAKYPKAVIKDVELGVKHIKLTKYYKGKPVKINIIEVNQALNPNLKVSPRLARNGLTGRVGISNIAAKNNSIVAINGTFFKPQTGVPLGTLMIDGELQTGPIYDRVAMGFFDNYFDTARIQLNASIKTGKEVIKIDNVNQPRMLSTYMLLYTPKWGKTSAPTPKYGIQVAISNNRVVKISADALTIPENGYVISGPAIKLKNLKEGDAVKVDIETIPQWKDVKHIISGGPYLMKNGEVFIDVKEERLLSITGRNPRTAIGYTADNHLILLTADGREASSIGLTLTETAYLMKAAGCYEAINLDGGGSSVLYIKGQIMNSPAQKGGIALSNALTVSL